MDFVDLILDVHRRLTGASIPHAFGGALALGYVAEPRGTADIDVNVFLAEDQLDLVDRALQPLAYARSGDATDRPPIAGIRYSSARHPFPLDVFPDLHERYAEVRRRRVLHPFGRGRDRLPFLSADDLCVFKLSFGRPKDWLDLRSIVENGTALDLDYIEAQVIALRGPTLFPDVARLRALADNAR